jgi:glycosyltransferase involved in cell wall biosynthesis
LACDKIYQTYRYPEKSFKKNEIHHASLLCAKGKILSRTLLCLAIRSLNIGGAERQFIELVKHLDKEKYDITVCTMYGGTLENELLAIPEITHINLAKNGRFDLFAFKRNYDELLNKIDPDIIYSFMGEMNLFSLWCKPKSSKVIWGIRASNMDLRKYGIVSQLIFWLQKIFSHKVSKIISNSFAAITFLQDNGFNMSKALVVNNGIDTHRFQFNKEKRAHFRSQLDLPKDAIVLGTVARIDPMKGYDILSEATVKLLEKHSTLFIVAVGDGDQNIKEQCQQSMPASVAQRFLWLGKRTDVENIYSGFDIFVSASKFGEGFSNVIAEAMSCGLPCVVTDVGDNSIIVGDMGMVVKADDSEELYQAISTILHQNYTEQRSQRVNRIRENFSIRDMVVKTESIIDELAT